MTRIERQLVELGYQPVNTPAEQLGEGEYCKRILVDLFNSIDPDMASVVITWRAID